MFMRSHSKRGLTAAACLGLSLFFGTVRAQNADENLLARDLTVAQRPIYQYQQQQTARPAAQRLAVDAWVDRRDGLYQVGEPIVLTVRPQADAYITVLNYGTSGRMTVMFPNAHERDAKVRRGQTVTIPGIGARYQIASGGPAGVEILQVIASSKPLSLPEVQALASGNGSGAPFVSFGRSAEDVARDLVLQTAPPQGVPAAVGASNSRLLLVRIAGQAASVPVYPGQTGVPAPVYASTGGGYPPYAGSIPQAPPQIGGFAPQLLIGTDRPAYQAGEPVHISVVSAVDCHLAMWHVGPGGVMTQLYPNAAQPASLLPANQLLLVPPPNSGIEIVAHAPAGVETVIGRCLPTGQAAAAQFVTAQRSAVDVERDLAIVAAPAGVSDAPVQAAAAYFVTQ